MGMVEDANRSRDIAGLPKTEYTTISGFMKYIEENSYNLPLYDGELYLELHRGTLTQMHDIKRGNRKAEFALRDLEYMSVLSGNIDKKNIDTLYKSLLLNQFHDILPGTSYLRYDTRAKNSAIISSAKTDAGCRRKLHRRPDSVTFFNTTDLIAPMLSWTARFLLKIETQTYTDVRT